MRYGYFLWYDFLDLLIFSQFIFKTMEINAKTAIAKRLRRLIAADQTSSVFPILEEIGIEHSAEQRDNEKSEAQRSAHEKNGTQFKRGEHKLWIEENMRINESLMKKISNWEEN